MEIEKIKVMIDRALVDGKLSRAESQAIKAAIYADKKVTPEEAKLFQDLQSKVWKGEVLLED